MATKNVEGLHNSMIAIQKQLKAPKDLYNKFGQYKYRSAESILEAVKPLLAEYGVLMTITDEIVVIGNRFYVKSIVTVKKGDETLTNVGFAREDETKKGMDGSQVTGASSSYARKYALNGLFLIDDTKDADTDEYHNQTNQPKAKAQPAKEIDFETELKAEADANNCQSSAELTAVWSKYKTTNPELTKVGSVFYKAVQQRGSQLKAQGL
jgi:hypothetical protein